METKCPQCSQRLRVPDGLSNPLLRCRGCGTTFRLQSSLRTVDERDLEPEPSHWSPSQALPSPSSQPARTDSPATGSFAFPGAGAPVSSWSPPVVVNKPSEPVESSGEVSELPQRRSPSAFETMQSFGRGSLGTITLVIVLMLLKGGPRLARQFFGERRPHNVPQQMDEEQQRQALQRLRDIEQQHTARKKLLEQEPDFQTLPDFEPARLAPD